MGSSSIASTVSNAVPANACVGALGSVDGVRDKTGEGLLSGTWRCTTGKNQRLD